MIMKSGRAIQQKSTQSYLLLFLQQRYIRKADRLSPDQIIPILIDFFVLGSGDTLQGYGFSFCALSAMAAKIRPIVNLSSEFRNGKSTNEYEFSWTVFA